MKMKKSKNVSAARSSKSLFGFNAATKLNAGAQAGTILSVQA
jgi:hypothetical protein